MLALVVENNVSVEAGTVRSDYISIFAGSLSFVDFQVRVPFNSCVPVSGSSFAPTSQ